MGIRAARESAAGKSVTEKRAVGASATGPSTARASATVAIAIGTSAAETSGPRMGVPRLHAKSCHSIELTVVDHS